MDRQKQFGTATGFGLNMPKMILQTQVHFLRLWADNIEKLAQFYEGETDTLRSRVEQAAQPERAA